MNCICDDRHHDTMTALWHRAYCRWYDHDRRPQGSRRRMGLGRRPPRLGWRPDRLGAGMSRDPLVVLRNAATQHAIGCRARGDYDNEWRWLDALTLLDQHEAESTERDEDGDE